MKDNRITCKNPECCGYEDYVQSLYCSACGKKFEKEQINSAFKKTIFGNFQDATKGYKKFRSALTIVGKPEVYLKNKIINIMPIKIILIIVFILLGSYMYITNKPLWNGLTLLPSSNYYLSKDNSKFHISTSQETISLKIGTVKDIEKAEVSLADNNDNTYLGAGDEIKVIKDKEYILNVEYKDGSTESLKFVFNK